MTGSERRNTQRFQMRLPLTVRWTTGAAVGETSTESRDVSSRGVYFFLSKDVKQGSAIEILLTLPNEITLAGPVRVRCLGRCSVPKRATKVQLASSPRSNAMNFYVATKNARSNVALFGLVFRFYEFLARSLRRRARLAGVPRPLSGALRLLFFHRSSRSSLAAVRLTRSTPSPPRSPYTARLHPERSEGSSSTQSQKHPPPPSASSAIPVPSIRFRDRVKQRFPQPHVSVRFQLLFFQPRCYMFASCTSEQATSPNVSAKIIRAQNQTLMEASVRAG